MAATTTKTAAPKPAKTGGGVKKATRPAGPKGSKAAMALMQAYFKEHRAEYKHLDFKEQQKELGKKWKSSPDNPKNQS